MHSAAPRGAPRRCIANGQTAAGLPGGAINRDLRPRDEYFINNERVTPELRRVLKQGRRAAPMT